MRQLDPSEQIATGAQAVCCVLGNIQTGDFALVDLALVVPDETAAGFHARGLGFVATFGVVDGKFVSSFEVPVSDQLAALLFQDYSVFLLKKFTAKSCGDGVAWLTELYALIDPREH